ncbi:RING-HC finger protein [Wolbachia endosymbiont of Pentidionis agamae]
MCQICEDRQKSVAFRCGHCCCSICVERLSKCHICRGTVAFKIRLY